MTRSISMQIASVRHCISAANVSDEIKANAEAGLRSLEWLERQQDLLRAMDRLWRDPVVKAFFAAFPGSEFTGPRE